MIRALHSRFSLTLLSAIGLAATVRISLPIPQQPSASSGTTIRGDPAEVVAWIRQNAARLNTDKPKNGFQDLEPLQRIIGSARIVALGEATHGSREFFFLK